MTKDEIIKLSDKELRIKAALLAEHGLGVDWGYGDAGMIGGGVSLHAIDWENVDKNWWEYVGMIITNGTRYTYLVKHKKFGKVELAVSNYPNDLIVAMELWKQIPNPKQIWWDDEEDEDIELFFGWDDLDEIPWDYGVAGTPEELPRLLTQAFVIYKEGKENEF